MAQGELAGSASIVTGAAQGLGEAIVRRLAQEGADVAIFDINLEQAQQVASEVAQANDVKTLAAQVDVTNAQQVDAAFEKVSKSFGKLDLLVSNAGILIADAVEAFDEAKWRKVINVNLIGYFLVARAAARIMIPQKFGNIIQINSKSGKKGSFKSSAYAASKFGAIGFTQSIALELAPQNIRVNAICPGNLLDSPLWTDSLYAQYAKKWGITEEEVRQKYLDQVPLGRGCTYEDVCNVLVFLASERANYMTGQAINVTGGQEMR